MCLILAPFNPGLSFPGPLGRKTDAKQILTLGYFSRRMGPEGAGRYGEDCLPTGIVAFPPWSPFSTSNPEDRVFFVEGATV